MDRGFVVGQGYNSTTAPEWVEGEPVKSFWQGGLDLRGKEQLPVATYRCRQCGFLESYARA